MRQVYPIGVHGIANDWVTDRSTLSFERGLNVQSGHSEGLLRVSELCSIGTGVIEKVTKTFHSSFGWSSPVLVNWSPGTNGGIMGWISLRIER